MPPRRVLVVDDNVDAGDSMAMLLEFLGAQTRVVRSGAQALELYPTWAPSLVFMDIGMPDMDGYEVARHLRTRFPEQCATLIALTGWDREEDRQRARDAGFDRHLVKPADVGMLETLIASM